MAFAVFRENLRETKKEKEENSQAEVIVPYSSHMRLVVYIGLHNQSSPVSPLVLSHTFALSSLSLSLFRPHIWEFLIARVSPHHPVIAPTYYSICQAAKRLRTGRQDVAAKRFFCLIPLFKIVMKMIG